MGGQYGTTGTERFEATREAILTLIDALKCDENDIDLAMTEFYRVRGSEHEWSKDYASLRAYVADPSQFNHMNYSAQTGGTNWEAGLSQGYEMLQDRPDNDNTYVIFLTDGEPNGWGNNSYSTNNIPQGYNRTTYAVYRSEYYSLSKDFTLRCILWQ